MDRRGWKSNLSKGPEAGKSRTHSKEGVGPAAQGVRGQGAGRREEMERERKSRPELSWCCELMALTIAWHPRLVACHTLSC